MDSRDMARGLAWFGIGLGFAELLVVEIQRLVPNLMVRNGW